MRCKNCFTVNPDDAVFCQKCGQRLDGKIECPVCHELTPAGHFCVKCGASLDGITGESEADDVTMSGYGGSPVKDSSRMKQVSFISMILGLCSAGLSFVFMFFVGVTSSASILGISGSDGWMWYRYFGGAYKDIKDFELYYGYTNDCESVAGAARSMSGLCTFLAVLFLILITACAIAVVYKYLKSRKGEKVRGLKSLTVMTYFLYLAFALSFKCILAMYISGPGMEAKITLNGATIAGTIICGLLTGASVAGQAVSGDTDFSMFRKDRGAAASYLKPLIYAVVLIILAGLLSGVVFGFKEEEDGLTYIVRMSPLSYRTYYDDLSYLMEEMSSWDTACAVWQVFLVLCCTLYSSLLLSRYIEDAPILLKKGQGSLTASDEAVLAQKNRSATDWCFAIVLLLFSILMMVFGSKLLGVMQTDGDFEDASRTVGVAVTALVFIILICAAEVVFYLMGKRQAASPAPVTATSAGQGGASAQDNYAADAGDGFFSGEEGNADSEEAFGGENPDGGDAAAGEGSPVGDNDGTYKDV